MCLFEVYRPDLSHLVIAVLQGRSPVHEDLGFLSEGNRIIKGHERSTFVFRIKPGLLGYCVTLSKSQVCQ